MLTISDAEQNGDSRMLQHMSLFGPIDHASTRGTLRGDEPRENLFQ